MISQLASRPFAVEELFAAPFVYVSPSFQRPFSWEEENAERLLCDIEASSTSSPDDIYFLGALLLVRIPVAGELQPPEAVFAGPERVFEIVDGQQRLVTLALLLAVLRDLLSRDPGRRSPVQKRLSAALETAETSLARVRLRGVDSAFLNHCIGEVGATLVPPVNEVASVAQEHLLEVRDFFVQHLQLLEWTELVRLAGFLLTKCCVVSVVTNTIDQAYQMFTVLNDTGKKLTRSDILKAELISQTPPAERRRLTEVWDDLERRVGTTFEDLFSYVRTQDGRGAEPIVAAIRAQVAATPGGAAGFVTGTLAPTGRVLDIIQRAAHEGTPQSADINRLLRYLGWLSGKEWVPPLLSYWLKHPGNAPALLEFLRALERFCFGVRIQGLGADKRAQRMVALNALITGGAPVAGPWPPLQFARDELRAINFNLRDLHKRSPPVCKMVLQRLNEHIGGPPIALGSSVTIEHILPLKIADRSQWKKDFPDTDERLKFATCLGNLTLVPAVINDRAANHDFDRKSAVYFGSGSETLCRLTNELRGYSRWTSVEIEARQTRLRKALDDIWTLGG